MMKAKCARYWPETGRGIFTDTEVFILMLIQFVQLIQLNPVCPIQLIQQNPVCLSQLIQRNLVCPIQLIQRNPVCLIQQNPTKSSLSVPTDPTKSCLSDPMDPGCLILQNRLSILKRSSLPLGNIWLQMK